MIQDAFDKIQVTPVAITMPLLHSIPNPEGLMAFCARVSNPSNQDNFATADKLLKYCIDHNHWSVFEMVNLVLEIKAPRDISRQILRHRSNPFQEFSQRYADVTDDMFCIRELRMQDDNNRQNSVLCGDSELHDEWENDQRELLEYVQELQDKWRGLGAAKEVVRVLLPEGLTMSTMYMNTTVRNLIHYIQVREGNGTQKEHVAVAKKAALVMSDLLPSVFTAINKGLIP